MNSFKVKSVNISKKKGTVKTPVQKIILNDRGVQDDAHAGNWHRQVSLLSVESMQRAAEQHGRKFNYGDFAENITTEGFELHKAAVFDRYVCGDIVLEMTQIGKKCHSGCAIAQETGDCIMPKEGIFCKVVQGGEVKEGDVFEYIPRVVKVLIVTMSDRASAGEYEDKSGPFAEDMLSAFFKNNIRQFSIDRKILPDSEEQLKQEVLNAVENKYDIIITTGGTGIGPRDITPDVIKQLLDKEITGIMELIRVKYGQKTPNALISRSVAGTIGTTLIYTLPGSVKAVKEYLDEIMPTIEHSFRMIQGLDVH